MKESKGLRITSYIARYLLGLIFFVFGFGYFFMTVPPMDPASKAGMYMAGLMATGYFMPFLKIVEGICGILLFFKRTTPAAIVVLGPIIIQIFLFFAFLQPAGIIMGIVLIALEVFLACYYWEKFEGIFKA